MMEQTIIQTAKQVSKRLKFPFPYDIAEWVTQKNMLMENYHKHTTWSNLVQFDSATDIIDFMRKSQEYGCTCYFSGEHGFQGEWAYVYDLCKSTQDESFRSKNKLLNPMKFRYSTEAYWVKDRLREYPVIDPETGEAKTDSKTGEVKKSKDRTNCHIVLVARTYQAIRKINYIISEAHDNGFYGKPRIDLELLFQLSPDEVYVTSACLAGWKYEDATEIWYRIWQHFGDSFFLEYQTHNTEPQKELNRRIYALSKEFGIQTIIGLDTHYIDDEDRIKRDNLLKRKKIFYDDEVGWYMDFPNGREVYQRMIEQNVLPEEEILYAMMNTHVFVDGCQDITLSTNFKIPIIEEYQQYNYEQRAEILKKILDEEFEKEDMDHHTEDRKEGLTYEFGEIRDSKTADYFLFNHRLVDLAVNQYGGQLTTTSRGSASSYYCSKLLGFTSLDRFEAEVPIYPERFITKDRILASHQMPDIDMNVAKQEPFIRSGKELCGEHGCYPLLAVGKLGEKSGFKLYAGIRGIEPTVANNISKCIDRYNEALKQADDDEEKQSILIEDYITDPEYLRIFNESKPYQDIVEQEKVHACGFFLFNGDPEHTNVEGYGDLRYEIGLIRCQSKTSKTPTMVVNIEGSLLDKFGYVKDDFLIVDVVGLIYKLYHAIGKDVPTVSQLRKMVTGDSLTWDLYAKGITCCLNQCEKAATTKRVMKYRPQNVKELAAFIAAIRPGFKSLIDGFLNRIPYSNGEPAIDELLDDCFHYMLYQEAVMKIFSFLGIPMQDSYDTIKKISKKKLIGEALQKVENNMKSHWLENIGNTNNFAPVYKVIKDSARYSFNAPHALSMAFDSLYEAWMKAHYPSVFYEVVLNHYQEKGNKNKIAELEKEAKQFFGYSIGSYEYGADNSKFTVDDEKKIIYPSLSSVKDIGVNVVQSLYEIAQSGLNDFVRIYLTAKNKKINTTVLRKLISIRYFHRFGSVKKLLQAADMIDYWYKQGGRSTINKSQIAELGLTGINLSRYATDITKSGKVSASRWTISNLLGLVQEIFRHIPNDEYSAMELIQLEYDVLGYVEYKNPDISPRYVAILDLDTTYSPKFLAYCLKTGETCEMKIHNKLVKNNKQVKTSFQMLPVQNGDVIYMISCKEEPKRTKDKDGEWKVIPGVSDWWINDYRKITSEDAI